jgi:hypothetical protein
MLVSLQLWALTCVRWGAQQEKGGRLEGGGRKKTSKAKESRPDPEEATSSSAGYFATVPATEG